VLEFSFELLTILIPFNHFLLINLKLLWHRARAVFKR